MIDMFD